MDPVALRIRPLVAEILDLIRPLADRRGIRLIADDLPDLYVLADDQRLKQVLLNLVSNAVKYTRGRLPVEPIHQEPAEDRSAALRREAAIKRLSRKKKLALPDQGRM